MNSPSSLSGETILCLATQGWDAHWTPVQQVMLRMAPHNRVIYVEPFHPPFSWLKKANPALHGKHDHRVPALREVRPNLFVYRPTFPYLPFNMKSAIAEKWNGRLYKSEIRRLLKKMGVTRPVLWAFFAQSLTVLNLPFKFFVYDCVDDWPAFFPEPREKRFVTKIDEALCRRAALVFAGSNPLREKKIGFNPQTFVVNHGADISHFMKAADASTSVPPDMEQIPHPRIGFVGMVDEIRFDAGLIARMAADSRQQIVIVGGFVGNSAALLPQAKNIHLLGMKPVTELPGYLKGMDVCLMPYCLNEATRNIYPLKLHEYLATGKPVVTTAIPAVESFRNLMFVADSPEDFSAKVTLAIQENDPAMVARRIESARKHTWEAHVEKKVELICRHLLRT